MRALDLAEFLHILGATNIEVTPDSEWVRSSCPLAPYTHAKGRDRRPSFGAKINDQGESSYNCFTCGSSSLGGLVHRITWLKGYDKKVHSFYQDHEIFDANTEPKIYNPSFSVSKVDSPVPVPYRVIECYPALSVLKSENPVLKFERTKMEEWFTNRGISLDIVREYGVRMDVPACNIIFPVRDKDYKIYHLHARSRKEKIFYYYTAEYLQTKPDWGRKDFWYGIEFVDFAKPVILVESETDVLKLRTLGINNVMASCGGVGAEKLKRIHAGTVILGFDSDETGIRYCRKAIHELHSSAKLIRISWKHIKRNINGTEVPIKDAADLATIQEWETVWEKRKIISVEGGEIKLESIKKDKCYPDKFAGISGTKTKEVPHGMV